MKRELIFPLCCGCFVCVSGGAGIKSNWNEIEMVSRLLDKKRRYVFILSMVFRIVSKDNRISTTYFVSSEWLLCRNAFVVASYHFIVSMAHRMEGNIISISIAPVSFDTVKQFMCIKTERILPSSIAQQISLLLFLLPHACSMFCHSHSIQQQTLCVFHTFPQRFSVVYFQCTVGRFHPIEWQYCYNIVLLV